MPTNKQRALVFVVILWAITILTALAVYFGHSARLAYRSSATRAAGLQADSAIDSAIEYASYILETLDTKGAVPDLEEDGYDVEDVAVGEAHFWFLGYDKNLVEAASSPTYGFIDEASKLNINTAELEMLEALPGMTAEAAAAIVDWRDLDAELTPNGAEDQEYATLDTPYMAKGSEFETVMELRHVKGITPDILFGEDRNQNGLLDPNEDDGDESWPPDNGDGRLDGGIARFVTTFSREPNTREDGSAKVNLSGQSARQDLTELVAERLGGNVMDTIIGATGNDLGRPESVLEFYRNSNLPQTQFTQLEDALTTTSGDYRVGAINVATAPVEVLACLPGVTREKAEELVTAREGLDASQLESVTWLATVLDVDTCRLVGPHVTSRSWQYGLDICAVGRNGQGFRRALAVLDVEDGVHVIYRRDLAREGWPLGDTILSQIKESAKP